MTTRVIKGLRLAILTHRHTEVIDVETETVTEIDYAKKTYSVTPFAQLKKPLEEAASKGVRETGFKMSREPGGTASSRKPIGVLNSAESAITLTGSTGALTVSIDSWIGTVPGYEQMRDFTDRLAAKMGYPFAEGLSEQAMKIPEAWPGLEQALKVLNQSPGAPIESTIRIAAGERSLGEVSIELSKFAGGAQPIATFTVPDGFKKVDAKQP